MFTNLLTTITLHPHVIYITKIRSTQAVYLEFSKIFDYRFVKTVIHIHLEDNIANVNNK